MLGLFRETETKFRDSSEYSDCVQNGWARSCLPCQMLYVKQQFFGRARKSLRTSWTLQCYAVLISKTVSHDKAPPAKESEKGYGDENAV